jgi:Zn-dependent metalloprotease
MAVCPFCKGELSPEATRCPYCTSFLDGDQTPRIPGKVVYVFDRGLVTFVKYAGSILAIFLTVGLSFYFLDLKKLGEDVAKTHTESEKLSVDIAKAQLELDKQRTDLENKRTIIAQSVSAAQSSASDASKSAVAASRSSDDAAATLKQIGNIRDVAERSGHEIEEYRIRFVVPVPDVVQKPTMGENPIQLEKTIETKVLQILKLTLTTKQYADIESKIKATATIGLSRRIFDARNNTSLPGNLVRSEGDAPSTDALANQIYDHLGTVHTFMKEVFARDIAKDANGLIATIHYGKKYNNAFWNGTQLTIGDADGKSFKEGAFTSLQVVASELCHAVTQKTSQLNYQGQSGGMNTSFSDVCAVLIEQWMKQQTVEEASWLLLPGAFVEGSMALRSVKEPANANVAVKQLESVKQFSEQADPHISSGIPDKAFYELAKRLKGHAWEKPAKIWYEAYLTLHEKSTFQDLADAMVNVATRLYGASSAEREAVVQGWAAVGITTGSS